jgi:hypothetical protein
MTIGSVGLVQTLQPARPASQPQPVSMPPDTRDTAAQDARDAAARDAEQATGREPPRRAPEAGKGMLVDRSA